MNDKELLELAAKALNDPKLFANTTGAPWQYWIGFCEKMQCDVTRLWNPLKDDGDAFRLAVALDVSLRLQGDELTGIASWWINGKPGRVVGNYHSGRPAEARRLIVRAAAEIGKAMQEKR